MLNLSIESTRINPVYDYILKALIFRQVDQIVFRIASDDKNITKKLTSHLIESQFSEFSPMDSGLKYSFKRTLVCEIFRNSSFLLVRK